LLRFGRERFFVQLIFLAEILYKVFGQQKHIAVALAQGGKMYGKAV